MCTGFENKDTLVLDTRVYLFLWGEMMNEWIITTVAGLAISAITYFLKRTMNQVDGQGKAIQKVKDEAVTRTENKEQVTKLEKEIRQIRDDYTPTEVHQKAYDECRNDIKEIRAKYLTKDDFIREMNKMDRKLDRMLEIMMEK